MWVWYLICVGWNSYWGNESIPAVHQGVEPVMERYGSTMRMRSEGAGSFSEAKGGYGGWGFDGFVGQPTEWHRDHIGEIEILGKSS